MFITRDFPVVETTISTLVEITFMIHKTIKISYWLNLATLNYVTFTPRFFVALNHTNASKHRTENRF